MAAPFQPSIWAKDDDTAVIVYTDVKAFILRMTYGGPAGRDRADPDDWGERAALLIELLNNHADALIRQTRDRPAEDEYRYLVPVTGTEEIIVIVSRVAARKWSWRRLIGKPGPVRFRVWFTRVIDRRTGLASVR